MRALRVVTLVVLSLCGFLVASPSQAAVAKGTPCPTLNSVAVSGGLKFTCVKSGNKKVWNAGVRCTKPGVIMAVGLKNYSCDVVATKNVLTETPYLWADEFNGSIAGPSSTNWTPSYGTGWPLTGWGNNELESYEDYANRLDGSGSLVITASRSKAMNGSNSGVMSEWVSGKITTVNRVNFLYGKLEARIQIPSGAGTWPAFWMLGADYPTVPWPWSGEIDIMEIKGSQPAVLWQTLHGPAGGGAKASLPNQNTYNAGVALSSTYHTYGIQWQPNQLSFTLDGQVISTVTSTQWASISSADWPFNKPYYAILNLAMGGNFAGGVSGSLNTATMKVDWVRYSKFNGYGKVTLK